jgi:hypothetical protein
MTASAHDSADGPSADKHEPNRRDFLEICGAASLAALATAAPEATAAGPVARCLAPEFLQPQEVTDPKKWEWELAQPRRVSETAGVFRVVPRAEQRANQSGSARQCSARQCSARRSFVKVAASLSIAA